jgi:RNA polymerase sigma-70 factor (ECF subfamily)
VTRSKEEPTEDDTAVRRARDGDLEAYELLVARYSPVGHRLAVFLGAGDEVEDVLQVAFVKAYRALGGFREGAAFRPWFLRIVANEAHNATRGRARRAGVAARLAGLALPDGPREPAEQLLARERRDALLAAVGALPEKERLAVTYRYLLDLSEAETAAALGWPKGSVKSRLSRALARLQDQLGAGLTDEERAHG